MCGGTCRSRRASSLRAGLSPRVRGNPRPRPRAGVPGEVYPRVCGGTQNRASGARGKNGLSPRVRGNRHIGQPHHVAPGSIPACAGEPRFLRLRAIPWQVYPRVCGGTGTGTAPQWSQTGLSPRVRGNRCSARCGRNRRRSIPACAGEPGRRRRSTRVSRVYPRVCGGTLVRSPFRVKPGGLSPRVRGNPAPGAHAPAARRSIPACAGEPPAISCRAPLYAVYPRVCGGTKAYQRLTRFSTGLSPRVRGNPDAPAPGRGSRRSIPACAGEPRPSPSPAGVSSVYPRVCGGTPR